MTWKQFIWIIGEINGYVDTHSSIANVTCPCWTVAPLTLDEVTFFPNVTIKHDKVYLMGSNKEIVEINGIKVAEILRDIKQFCNWKNPHERNWMLLQDGFSYFLLNKYEMREPFKVMFSNSTKVRTLKGISAREYFEHSSLPTNFRGNQVVPYKIYPFSDIAIFTICDFLSVNEKAYQNLFDNFCREVERYKIKHIFYDLTQNSGGQFSTLWNFGMNALNIIKHDDIFFKVTETKRTEQGNNNYRTKKVVLKSNRDTNIPDNMKLFILQGGNTTSCADYFCRIVAENKLGVLIGQNTGEPTKAFTYTDDYVMMPNSKWPFQVATTLFDFSEYFDTETLHPDLYWDVNNNREFTEEELVKIVQQCKTIKMKR